MIDRSPSSQAVIVILSLFLSILSYHFIENRYRRPTINLSVPRSVSELSLVAVIVTSCSILIISEQGLGDRIPAGAMTGIVQDNTDSSSVMPTCQKFGDVLVNEKGTLCHLGNQQKAAQFIVWGDSHARAIAPALHRAALNSGVSGYSFSTGGCRPLIGVFREYKTKCLDFNNEVVGFIKSHPAISDIFIAGYWRIAITSQGYDNSNYFIRDKETEFISPAENKKVFQRSLARLLIEFQDKTVIIIEDVPEIGSQFGKAASNHLIRNNWLQIKGEFIYHDRTDSFSQEFADILAGTSSRLELLKIKPLLCHSGECPLLIDGKLVYKDGDHLSEDGALLLAPAFQPYMDSLARTNTRP